MFEFNGNVLVFFGPAHLLGFSARQGLENPGVVCPLGKKMSNYGKEETMMMMKYNDDDDDNDDDDEIQRRQ